MFVEVVLSVLFCLIAFASTNTYKGCKIYDIYTRNLFEKELIRSLSENSDYDFFVLPKALEVAARVMVSPEHQYKFETILKSFGIKFGVVDKNVGRTTELQREQNQLLLTDLFTHNTDSISFTRFQRYIDIIKYLDKLHENYPDRVTVYTLGKSYQKRDLKAITISNGDGRENKKVILLEGGMHAREWISPAAALYVIHQLVENFNNNRHLLEDYNWIVVPLVNPDGYEYTHTKSRLWRKNRKPSSSTCVGTDGNRNFNLHWGRTGASSYPCANIYKGSRPFSEPETQVLRDLMHSLSGRAKMYLSLHSYGKFLLYPWSHTSARPSNWIDIDYVAKAGAAAIKEATGTKYAVGSSSELLYPVSGSSDDYAFAVAKIPIAITMELPPGGNGFDPRPSQIMPMVSETWIGIKAMAKRVISQY